MAKWLRSLPLFGTPIALPSLVNFRIRRSFGFLRCRLRRRSCLDFSTTSWLLEATSHLAPNFFTVPNIVTLYGQDDPFFTAVRLGLAFSLTIAIPLNVFPIRESVENMQLFRKLPTAVHRRLLGPATDPKMRATREHEIVGVTLVLIPMILSLAFRNVVRLITILGGSLVSLMMIVFPCIVLRMICSSSLVWWTTLMFGISFATFLALASWGFVGEKV